MLVNVGGLPRVADPLVADGAGGMVVVLEDVLGEDAFLLLVLVLRGVSDSLKKKMERKKNSHAAQK
jgi:hypothetical protein